MRIVTVVGARPQFIKAAVVSHAFARTGRIEEALVHTGQHYDAAMSDVFFDELGIPAPQHNLGIGSSAHGRQTGAMMQALEPILEIDRPDVLLVYGDTNSTLAGALVAAKMGIRIAHVEAGLRSFNRTMPEEVNRVLTDHVSDMLFAPTEAAVEHLRREGISGSHVVQVGDVMFDTALHFRARALERNRLAEVGAGDDRPYVLATIHRAENTDDPVRLRAIVEALGAVARDRRVIFAVHPRTRARIAASEMRAILQEVKLVEPLGYLDMMAAEIGAELIVTDSGGVQKEAFFHRRPCVTVRTETEWTELVESGWNRLADPRDAAAIRAAIEAGIGTSGADVRPYGDGDAADRIAQALLVANERGGGRA